MIRPPSCYDAAIVGDLMGHGAQRDGPVISRNFVADFRADQLDAVAEETAFNRTLAPGSRLPEEVASPPQEI